MKNLTSTLEYNYLHSLTDQHQPHPKQHSSLHHYELPLPNININPSYDNHRKCSFQHQLLPPHQSLMQPQAHHKESSVLYHSHPTLLQLSTANTNNKTSTIFPMIKLTYPNHGKKSMDKTNTFLENNDRHRFNVNDNPITSSKTKSTYDLMAKQSDIQLDQNRSYPNISSIFKSNKGRLDLSFTKCQFPDDYLPYAVSSNNERRTFSTIVDNNLFNKKRSNSFDVIGSVNTNSNNTGRYHQRSASDFQPPEEEVKHGIEVNDWQLNEYDEECCFNVSKKQQQQPTMEIVVSKLNVCHDDDQLGFNDRKISNETPLTSTATATSSSSIVLNDNNHNDNYPKRSALFFTYPFYSPFRSSSSFNDHSTTGSGLDKSLKKHRQGLIKSFGCCVLMIFVVLILLSLSIVLGFSLYLAIVTNLFTETTFAYSLNGNFKIISGDNFTIKLINQTSVEFLQKSSRYEKILHNIFHASILSESILHHEIYSFRQGSLIVFFRFYATKRTFDRILDIKKSKTIINFGTIENVYLDDDVIVAQIRQILFDAFQEEWPAISSKNLAANSRANTMLEMDFNSLKISTFERLTESQYLDRLKRRRIYHDVEKLDAFNSILTNNDLQNVENDSNDIGLKSKKNFTSSSPSLSINFITKSISTTTASPASPSLMPASININKNVSFPTWQTNNSTISNNKMPSTGSILTTITDGKINPVNLDLLNGTFLNTTNDNRTDLLYDNTTNSSLNLNKINGLNWIEFNNNSTLAENEFLPEKREDLEDQSFFDFNQKKNKTFLLKTENSANNMTESTRHDQANGETIDGFLIDANKENTQLSTPTPTNFTTIFSINTNKILIKSEDSFDLYSLSNSTKTTLFDNFDDYDDDDDEDIESEFKLKPPVQDIATSTLSPSTFASEFVNNSPWNNIENEFTHMVKVEPDTQPPLTTIVTIRPVLAYGTRISKKLLNHSISNKYRPSSHENSLFNDDDYYNSIDQVDKYITTVINTKNIPTTTTTTTTTTPPPILCKSNEIRCNRTDTCISFDSICNRIMDCEDGSDELDCRCVDYLLRDETHRHKLCDGIIDCADLSDETANCPRCSEGMFVCIGHGSQCINMSKVCNGENDCINGDDEQNCIALIDNEEMEENISNANRQNLNLLVQSHNPSGLLHIQHHGQWAPLCFDSYDLDSENWIDHRYDENETISENSTSISISSMIQIDDMGQAVCKANYFAHLERIQIITVKNMNITSFYAISPKITDSMQPTLSIWSNLFEKSECKDRKVARIECSTIECGVRPLSSKIQRRIIGGQSASFGSWPWQVALYREGEFQCGAVVIDSQWLLTAAHCFYSTPDAFWTARIGVLRRGSLHRSFNEEIRNIERVYIHPEYVDKGFLNDIALLRLDRSLTYSKYIRPICLPEEEDSRISKWNNQLCTTVGWGKLFEHGRIFPDSLQEVKLPIISTDECRKRTMFLPLYKITNNMFCAGFEYGGRDACLGDSGGPMMCQKENGKWILLGITSNGDGCGRAGRPGVYTKVFNYLHWIQSIIIKDRFGKRMESDLLQHMDKLYKNNSEINLKKSVCTGHRCPLGRCLKPEQMCDHIIDCEDSSDERNCPEFKFIN